MRIASERTECVSLHKTMGISQLWSSCDTRSAKFNRRLRPARNRRRHSGPSILLPLHAGIKARQTEPAKSVLCAGSQVPNDLWDGAGNCLENVGKASWGTRIEVSFDIAVG